MFKNKKLLIMWITEWILPWLVLIPGIPAIACWSKAHNIWMQYGDCPEYEKINHLFHSFYNAAMGTGGVVLLTEIGFFFVFLVRFLIRVFRKNIESNSPQQFIGLWLAPLFFIPGTLLLIFFVHVFTYGMGI